MIKLTTPDSQGVATHYVSAENIARVTEAGASSRWHGIRAIVRLFDGDTLWVCEKSDWIAERVASAKETP